MSSKNSYVEALTITQSDYSETGSLREIIKVK